MQSLIYERKGDWEPGVLLHGLDENLLAAVGQVEGVADVRTEIAHGYPLLQLRATRRTADPAKRSAMNRIPVILGMARQS